MHKSIHACAFALVTICFMSSCGGNGYIYGDNHDEERVLSVIIDPSDPSPGDVVTVLVDQCITGVYPDMVGCGPTYTYKVNAGELSGYRSAIYTEPIRGTELQIIGRRVTWQLPDEPGKYWVEASLKDGGKKLKVILE